MEKMTKDKEEHFECLCHRCNMTSTMCRHKVDGPSKPSQENTSIVKHFESFVMKIKDIESAKVVDGVVYIDRYPIGMVWLFDKDFVEIHSCNIIKPEIIKKDEL
jgi:hypothetical protein